MIYMPGACLAFTHTQRLFPKSYFVD